MNTNTSTTTTARTFAEDLATARRVFASLGHFTGYHPLSAKAFVEAEDDAARQAVVDEWVCGVVRRGFRQMALRFEKTDPATAEVFWALRDDIDPETGDVFKIDPEAV